MNLDGLRVAITGAARDTGRLLAEAFAERGAQLFLSARNLTAAERVATMISRRSRGQAAAFHCGLAEADSVRGFAAAVAGRTEHLDVLLNNGAAYVDGDDLADVSDDTIESVLGAGGTGTVLLTKHLLPLLRASPRPDIINMISACGEVGHRRSGAHPAFYAAKHAHAGLAEILSHRLRPEGIRVISLFRPTSCRTGRDRRTATSPPGRSSTACCSRSANHETASSASSTSSRSSGPTPEQAKWLSCPGPAQDAAREPHRSRPPGP